MGISVTPRRLHPGAWWLWAAGLAAAASRTTNPLLLLLLATVAGYVVAVRRTSAPWARSYVAFLKLGLLVIAIRVVFQTVFGAAVAGRTVLFSLPEVPLPEWTGGLRIGGPVTAEALAAAAYDGLKLATVLVCIGAANALANPKRLLQALPGALYEAGVAVVVAMTFAPQLVADAGRVRAARRLRGRPGRGLLAIRSTAIPVLESALERSIALAAAMDSRGYGRTANPHVGEPPPGLSGWTGAPGERPQAGPDEPGPAPGQPAPGRAAPGRRAGILILVGLLGICTGTYGLLDVSSPPALGLPMLLAGTAAAVVGLVLGGRRNPRTRYRPDPWAFPEWAVAASGAVTAGGFIWAGATGVEGMLVPTVPLTMPPLPVVPLFAALVALAPAWLAPPPGEA